MRWSYIKKVNSKFDRPKTLKRKKKTDKTWIKYGISCRLSKVAVGVVEWRLKREDGKEIGERGESERDRGKKAKK